ncbi:MAG TPA: glutamate-5-semialdehyde dehydrogenase [Dehalococcoidia bacterium]|jgi:glutamate-5-semialdehyde dehydrogenase|nr:glutamate-5-semialdehyde dehydrogenase [Chloroflexota bacterium]MDP5876339.1 glutamate-5-semialdehyde dehydrogenase [Dehalococcoidia bacterium]MDP6274324.1 glutamate-5-semialdehyde dehydrogenase [Dehalococcoidia bacterium]MDP7212561.1 glutamate-5-semialdehyde dehydrogenase [Dehalococcoidia bacterium]MDP7514326.1 glutamate-5-semialdehyde dehydrogenase [Dehalococcoidia bacterium]
MTVSNGSRFNEQAVAARAAGKTLAAADTDQKNDFLAALAGALEARNDEIVAANLLDVSAAGSNGLGDHIVDRLRLDAEGIKKIVSDVRHVASLDDPVREQIEEYTRPNGLDIERVRAPLGLIGVIYESRPNVTIDIAALCLKAGNTVILRGGREAIHSNKVLAGIARDALESSGLPADAIQFIDSTDRAIVDEMLKARGLIDLLIPRGGEALINRVREDARVPAITGGIGVCHTYVDVAADLEKAVAIVVNAKTQRPSVCNALDTLLIHEKVAPNYLPPIVKGLIDRGVEVRCDGRSLAILEPALGGDSLRSAGDDDYGQEFLALVAAVKVVDSIDDALDHIDRFGSSHSEAIVTEDKDTSEWFLSTVDAAAVFSNASTYFHDGGEFGLGAEVAVSTDRLHARGPLGLREITTYKWVVRGDGQVRS